jgi:hypothetical protein
MDRPGQELFSRAALPGDEGGHIACGVKLRLLQQAKHLFRLGDDRRKGVLVLDLGKAACLADGEDLQEATPLEGPIDLGDKLVS